MQAMFFGFDIFYMDSFNILYLIAVGFRDASLRDLRANSGDLGRIGSGNDTLNTLKQDRDSDVSQQIRQDNYGGAAPRFQSGVLRTNCIDCLDRTNVAQYAYGLAALGRQLHAMGLTDKPKVDADSSIAAALMDMYQSMGDALAQQYGGSAAHNTVYILTLIEVEFIHHWCQEIYLNMCFVMGSIVFGKPKVRYTKIYLT